MQIQIYNPEFQTVIFSGLLFLALVLTIKKFYRRNFFDIEVTNQLKGVAILAVIFSHIGYFLSSDTRFLFPLSILAGVGVNLFLFLSGFGLTASAIKSPLSIIGFYLKRMRRIYLPFWLVLISLVIFDALLLGKSYPPEILWSNLLGWFPTADLFHDLDSPLWYFTFILFYYLIFPWLFWRKIPYLSPIFVYLLSFLILRYSPLSVKDNNLNLYQLHLLAFPLGMAIALLPTLPGKIITRIKLPSFLKPILIILLAGIFTYTAIHSGVGESKNKEQLISLITMFSLIGIFLLTNLEFRALSFFGIYSYEIYLFHWPLMYRYDLLYKNFPPFLATALYLMIFSLLAIIIQKTIKFVENKLSTT